MFGKDLFSFVFEEVGFFLLDECFDSCYEVVF